MEWYRDDLDEAKSKDPFPKLKTELLNRGFTKKELSEIEKKAKETVVADYEKAIKAEDPWIFCFYSFLIICNYSFLCFFFYF